MSAGLPSIPPPSEGINLDGSSATVLEHATIDAHTLYSVILLWKHRDKILGRTSPFLVVLRSDERLTSTKQISCVVLNRMQLQ